MKRSILFVCVGNICRSPMAAALMQQRLGDSGRAESAGVYGLSGNRASREAIAAAREKGLHLEHHRARHVRDLDLSDYDLIVALTPGIADVLRTEYGASGELVVALDIDDPYGADIVTFRRCLTEIEEQLEDHEMLRIEE